MYVGTHDHAVVAEGRLHEPLAPRLGDAERRGVVLRIVRLQRTGDVSSSPRER